MPVARHGARSMRIQDPGQRSDRRRRPRRPADPRHRAERRLLRLDCGHRADLSELSHDERRRARRAVSWLAPEAGLVQPRPVGEAREHPGHPVRRADAHQHRDLAGPGPVRRLRRRRRAITNPTIDGFIKPFGQEIPGIPPWPIFETLVGTLLLFGAIYYLISVRGRAADIEAADAVTGEATIG